MNRAITFTSEEIEVLQLLIKNTIIGFRATVSMMKEEEEIDEEEMQVLEGKGIILDSIKFKISDIS